MLNLWAVIDIDCHIGHLSVTVFKGPFTQRQMNVAQIDQGLNTIRQSQYKYTLHQIPKWQFNKPRNRKDAEHRHKKHTPI